MSATRHRSTPRRVALAFIAFSLLIVFFTFGAPVATTHAIAASEHAAAVGAAAAATASISTSTHVVTSKPPPPSPSPSPAPAPPVPSTCDHGPPAPRRACAGMPGVNAANCTPGDVFFRWHVTSQELLIRHLRALWPDDRPRVMVDLGSHASHGVGRNVSDAMLWLDHFNAGGSIVLAVDAIEDYALDLQHRFDVPPYASMTGVKKLSIHAAVGTGPGTTMCPCSDAVALRGSAAALGATVLRDPRTHRPQCIDLGLAAMYTNAECTRTDRRNDYERMDRAGASDHMCRIVRQRSGVSTSPLPLPRSRNNYTFTTQKVPPIKYLVPAVRADVLIQTAAASRRIDFLKIDIDMSWAALEDELLPFFRKRAFAVMVVELDNYDRPQAAALDKLVCVAHRHGYAALLKVPCAGNGRMQEPTPRRGPWQFPNSHRTAYVPVSGRYYQQLPAAWGTDGRQPCASAGGQHCNIQDVLVLDLRMRELRGLIELGNRECGTAFPSDLTREWAVPHGGSAAPLLANMSRADVDENGALRGAMLGAPDGSPPARSLVGERESLRPVVWRAPDEDADKKHPRQAAKLLPDGTWSCTVADQSATPVRCKQ